jgi:HD superfamily phosphohydrolase
MFVEYRDPIHGFIRVSELENRIIDSKPFQRLRYIKQLALTYLVYHGAEHSRFGHSLGVMHLVSKAFDSAVYNASVSTKNEDRKLYESTFTEAKKDWFRQILRIIAIIHDLGHAPFSHASEFEGFFPIGRNHEEFSCLMTKGDEIGEHIRKIGKTFKKKYGESFDITPELICDIYMGKLPGNNSEFTFLKTFMDSELDCDKMDYLLRDSYYCGVNYGKYDLERLISSFTVYWDEKNGSIPRLAIEPGGVQAFEEFMLARYFMFIQVYFHKTRRFFDKMFIQALQDVLPNGCYPTDVDEYLSYNDNVIMQLFEKNKKTSEACRNIINRNVYSQVIRSSTHSANDQYTRDSFDQQVDELYEKFGEENYLLDTSADKMPHKIPQITEIDDEKAIVIVDKKTGRSSTISSESVTTQKVSAKKNSGCPRPACLIAS